MNVGDKVIVRSGDWNESFKIGMLVAYDDLEGKAYKPIPVVEIEGTTLYIFGVCKKYWAGCEKTLQKLTPREQWNVLSDNIYIDKNRMWMRKGE